MWRKLKKKVDGGGGHLKKRREGKEKQHEMRCLEHIPTGMVLLDTSKASVVLNALFIRLCSCVTSRLRHTPVSWQIQTQALCWGAIQKALNLHKCLALAWHIIYSKSFKLLVIHIPHSSPIYYHTHRVIPITPMQTWM